MFAHSRAWVQGADTLVPRPCLHTAEPGYKGLTPSYPGHVCTGYKGLTPSYPGHLGTRLGTNNSWVMAIPFFQCLHNTKLFVPTHLENIGIRKVIFPQQFSFQGEVESKVLCSDITVVISQVRGVVHLSNKIFFGDSAHLGFKEKPTPTC